MRKYKRRAIDYLKARRLTYGPLSHEAIKEFAEWLDEQQPTAVMPLRPMPSAWMRGTASYMGPIEPPEYDYELEYGDDPPPGEGWIPLYREAKK